MKRSLIVGILGFFTLSAGAADLDWSGRYRFEGVFIKNKTLDRGAGIEDSYLTHHLILEPKITAGDGLTIRSRLDIFNNALGNNQIGQVFGSYTYPTGSTNAGSSSVLTHTQSDETLTVTELYLSWINEFSAFVVGRVPFHFGLGMTYSAGEGMLARVGKSLP